MTSNSATFPLLHALEQAARFLDESTIARLRIIGNHALLRRLDSLEELYFAPKPRRPSDFVKWPINELRGRNLTDLTIKVNFLDAYSTANWELSGYEAQNLPKTLVRATLHFRKAPSLFRLAKDVPYAAPLAHLNECFPVLTDLWLFGEMISDQRPWMLPSSLTRFRAQYGEFTNAIPFPPLLEHLMLERTPMESAFWRAIAPQLSTFHHTTLRHYFSSDAFTAADAVSLLPPTLTSLAIFAEESFTSLPPSLLHLELDNIDIKLQPWLLPRTLTSLRLAQRALSPSDLAIIPSSLTSLESSSTPNGPCRIPFSLDALFALPHLHRISFDHSPRLERSVLPALPSHLLHLNFSRSLVKNEDYAHLPLTLTELYAPSINAINVLVFEKMTNLAKFGAVSGKIARSTVLRLPRGLQTLELHNVAFDMKVYRKTNHHQSNHQTSSKTSCQTSASSQASSSSTSSSSNHPRATSQKKFVKNSQPRVKWRTVPMTLEEKIEAHQPKVFDLAPLNAFHDSLPDSLTSLTVCHHYDHEYYWYHAYEIYERLPLSLKKLHLRFRRRKDHPKTPVDYRVSPSYIRLHPLGTPTVNNHYASSSSSSSSYKTQQHHSSQSSPQQIPSKAQNNIFSRLINLKTLVFSYPAAASNDHSIPPLPPSLLKLYIECWLSFTKEDAQALPPHLIKFGTNLKAYSKVLEAVRSRKTRFRPHSDMETHPHPGI